MAKDVKDAGDVIGAAPGTIAREVSHSVSGNGHSKAVKGAKDTVGKGGKDAAGRVPDHPLADRAFGDTPIGKLMTTAAPALVMGSRYSWSSTSSGSPPTSSRSPMPH